MSPDGSETKFIKEMAKQPLTLMIRIESGVHTGMEDIHCVIPKRIRLPNPPPIATKKYLLIKTIRYSAEKSHRKRLHKAGHGQACRRGMAGRSAVLPSQRSKSERPYLVHLSR